MKGNECWCLLGKGIVDGGIACRASENFRLE